MRKWHSDAVIAELSTQQSDGVLIDGVHSQGFVSAMIDILARRRGLNGATGQLNGLPTPALRRLDACLAPDCSTTPLSGEQSNSSVLIGNNAIMKFIRRYEEGINPGVELGRYLSEVAHFPHAPRVGGSVELRARDGAGTPATIAVLEEFVENEGDGWRYVVDALTRGLEDALAASGTGGVESRSGMDAHDAGQLEEAHALVGPHLEWASLLGQRTGELHVALVSATGAEFSPEPLTAQDRQALFHGARSLTHQVLREVQTHEIDSAIVRKVLDRRDEIVERLRRLTTASVEAFRFRCHGDYHLGQVLWTGKDFYIIDFEGEPRRSLGWRRLKRPAAFDLAGMVRSFHYAAQAAALRISLEFGRSIETGLHEQFEDWLGVWHRQITARFLDEYLDAAGQSPLLPSSRSQLAELLGFFRLEKALYELSYEVNSRPTWVDVPARGILDILESDA
jgi:maltose alpha-D-glucosyltransferase/alpha-amylase